MTQQPLFEEGDEPRTLTLELLDKWISDCDSLDQRWAEILVRLRKLSDAQFEDSRKEVDTSHPQ